MRIHGMASTSLVLVIIFSVTSSIVQCKYIGTTTIMSNEPLPLYNMNIFFLIMGNEDHLFRCISCADVVIPDLGSVQLRVWGRAAVG